MGGGGRREGEESTLRAPLSGKLKEGCRKPVLGVCTTASHVGTLLPSARQHGSGGEVGWGVGWRLVGVGVGEVEIGGGGGKDRRG